MKLTPKEHVLYDAIHKLRDEDCEELVRSIGQVDADVACFHDADVIERAWDWAEEKIRKAPDFDIPPGILGLKSALKLFRSTPEEALESRTRGSSV